MTIGKKIGGGFFAIILLTTVLGFMAIKAMNNGGQVSDTIALDRLPRLLAWGKMQNDLLEGEYNLRMFYETRNPENMKRFFGLLQEFRGEIGKLKKLNEKNFFEVTAKGIAETEQLLDDFEKIVRKNTETYDKSEAVVKEMRGLVGDTLKSHDALNKVMFEVQRKYIRDVKTELALQYISLIEDSTLVYSDAARLMQELLSAERNHDLSLFIKVQESLPLISKSARAMAAKLHTEEGKKAFSVASKQYQTFGKLTHELVNAQREYVENGKLSFETFTRLYDSTKRMVALVNTNTVSVVENAASEFGSLTRQVSIILGLVLILGIIVAIVITRMIVKPLATTQQFAQEVAAGHLDHDLSVHTDDETGKLAEALRTMVSALKRNIAEARQKSEQAERASEEARKATANAEQAALQAQNAKKEGMLDAANQLENVVEIISSASTQLSRHIQQSDRSANESANLLQKAVAAMNEMNTTVQEVALNADSASTASGKTRAKAQAGAQVVKQVVQSIGQVQQTSLQLKDDMAQLNERAQDISRIMGVISDIADQTNLLALNAAIEAARAGEAGRGFAVVADEVRKLAEKTMSSTLDVSNAIRAIQESTDKSMNAVDNAASLIGSATELANQSGAALQEIVDTVAATSDQVQAIAKASQEQSAANSEINSVIAEVNDMSGQTAQAMNEATGSVADLLNQANELTSLIQEMKNA